MSYQDVSWSEFLKQKSYKHQQELKHFDVNGLPLTCWSWAIAAKKPRYDSKDMQYLEDDINGKAKTQK